MKKFYSGLLLSIIALFAAWPTAMQASHGMGADLTYNCLGGNTYQFRLSFYRDCSGITPSSSYTITVASASCGQNLTTTVNLQAGYPVEVSPICPAQMSQTTCNGGTLPGVQQYVYIGNIVLPMACTDWQFSWYECCRNSAITTLTAPGSEGMTIWATLNNVAAPCNNSPDFTTLPVPYICLGQPYVYNHGAIDPDGDVLVYTLVNAMNTTTTSVVYGGGFSGTNPMTSVPPVTINSGNGNVNVTPTALQQAVVTVRVDEYRNGVLIGSVMRDIQVTVLNCTNNAPTISPLSSVVGAFQTGPYTVEVCPGTPISLTIPGTDPDAGQTITWSWNNGIPGGVFTAPSGNSPQSATFTWTPTTADIGLNSLTVTLTDNACPVLGSQVRAIDIIVLDRTTAGPNQVYCTSGGPVQLNATGGTVFTWTILSGSPGSLSCTNCANPQATPSVPTTYVVQSNLSSGCINRDTVVVTPVPSFALAMSPPQTLCLGGSTAIAAVPAPAGAYTYSWAPGGSLSATNISSPNANPTVTTNYNVTVTSAAGCTMTGATTVNVSTSVLSTAPTATPTQMCAGGPPVTLNSNVSTGSCAQYTQAAITYAPVAGAGTPVVLGDDQVSGAIPIGFNFTFFCNTYSNVYISSNGFLSFDASPGSGCCSGQVLPNAGAPNNVIAACWDDLYPPGAGSISYFTTGIAPNRRFVVNYSGVPFCCGATPDVTSQIVIYETTNVVEIHTNNVSNASPATQGIENSTGTAAYFVAGRNSSAWSATNDAFRFTPVVPLPYTVTWQAPLGNTVGVGNTLNVTPGATTTYYAVVSNGVCSAGGSVLVDVTSVNAGPDQVICPGDDANLSGAYTGPPPPSNCNLYTVSSVPYAPQVIAGSSLTLGDDQVSGAVPLGFNFTFFCQVKTQVYFSSNGFITFNGASGSGCCSGSTLPTGTITDFIAGTWNDLYPPAGGSITYATVGTAPNRIFIANYSGINHCCSAGPVNTFQIQLYETTNIIQIHSTTITDDGSTHTMGIQDASGANFAVVAGRGGTNFTATNDAYQFAPQVGSLVWTWSPSTYLTSTNTSNTTADNVAATTTYTVSVNNGTCTVTDQVTVSTVCALAATITEFTGQREGSTSHLSWRTAQEQDVDRFILERSTDRINFSAIASVNAIGSPTSVTDYDHVDGQPAQGVNYYRLRVIDNDGSEDLSNIVEVRFTGDDNALMSVYPNPAHDRLSFDIALAPQSDATIEIFNLQGVKVYSGKAASESGGMETLMVDVSSFAAGTYLYTVKVGDATHNGKVEVTH